jgi:hypothetical protein
VGGSVRIVVWHVVALAMQQRHAEQAIVDRNACRQHGYLEIGVGLALALVMRSGSGLESAWRLVIAWIAWIACVVWREASTASPWRTY